MPTEDEFNLAIRACLSECYGSNQPLASLIEQVAKLRVRPGWSESDVAGVQQKAFQMLKFLIEPPELEEFC